MNHHPRPWYFTYSETGGYDCMTGGFTIFDAEHKVVTVVDQADFGQKHCDDHLIAEAEEVTRFIVESVNMRGK